MKYGRTVNEKKYVQRGFDHIFEDYHPNVNRIYSGLPLSIMQH